MGNLINGGTIVKFIKTVLLFINGLYGLAGLLLLIAGVWSEVELHKYLELSPDFSGTVPHVLSGTAVLMVVVSSVGFTCIYKQKPVLLYTYGGVMVCIFVMNIGFSIALICFKNTFPQSFYDGLTQNIITSTQEKTRLDLAQSVFHCCGVYNYTDWVRLSPQHVIPTSCCVDSARCVTANYGDVYQEGCYVIIGEYLDHKMLLVHAIAVLAPSYPMFGGILACALADRVKRLRYDDAIVT